MKPQNNSLDWVRSQEQLQNWYASHLGSAILQEIKSVLDRILPNVFGFQGLQVGQLSTNINLLESAGLHRKLILSNSTQNNEVDISGDAMHLPIASDTMNLVILPHSLEFCNDPHQVLRETDRILCQDGQLLIIGFNPYSLFGLRHFAMSWRKSIPWNGGFYSRGRLIDWLSLLSFRIQTEETFFLRAPINARSILHKSGVVEKAQPWIGFLGGVYVLHARKQTIPMSAVRNKWHRPLKGVAVGSLVHRASRQSSHKPD